jgi:hypothetical protein
MSRERNVLQELFTELSEDYLQQGWTIEYVDLRWGITTESSNDNRTMRICLNELARCQQLSPKPNFIVLLGQRRGWIPLPETLTEKEGLQLLQQNDAEYYRLFMQWYKLDTNQLPEALYILQPRTSRYINNEKLWEQDVAAPLRAGFCDLLSATELEIQHGALEVPDAKQHVIAYFRDLYNLPEDQQSIYVDKDQEDVNNTRQRLLQNVGDENVFQTHLSFMEYNDNKFAVTFKQEMRNRLTGIINKIIAEYQDNHTEASRHRDVATEKYTCFKGREDILKDIDTYIHDANQNHALWICAQSGAGKSALMAALYHRYRLTHNIICRFCGETEQSSNGVQLLNSIWSEMREYYPISDHKLQDLPCNNNSPYWAQEFTKKFKDRLSAIPGDRPLLILIDGLDQVTEEFEMVFNMECFSGDKLSPNVKIVLTSNKDERIYGGYRIQKYDLPLISSTDTLDIISEIMCQGQRKLSQEQVDDLRQQIDYNTFLPIYADLLGHFLCRYASYSNLPTLPLDLDGLLAMMVNVIISENHHDAMLVRHVLSMFACSRSGISQSEMLDALSIDEILMEHIRHNSYHYIAGNRIPPILWYRLYNDISFLLKLRRSKHHSLLYIYHNTIKTAIINLYFSDSDDVYGRFGSSPKYYIYHVLAKLYRNVDTPHALMEAINCHYMAVVTRYNTEGVVTEEAPVAISLITDIQFIHRKLQIDRADLLHDTSLIYEIAKVYNAITCEDADKLRKDIASLSVCNNLEDTIMQCYCMHSESYLRRMVNDSSKLLCNTLSDATPYDLITGVASSKLEPIVLGNDGAHILTLTHNSDKDTVTVHNLQGLGTQSYTIAVRVNAISASDNLSIHAFLCDGSMMVYDTVKSEVVERNNYIQNACWVSISVDGSTVAYGSESEIWTNVQDIVQSIGGSSGMLSPSGKFLWFVNESKLYRVNLETCELRCKTLESGDGTIYDTLCSEICAASDDVCVVGDDRYICVYHTYDVNGQKYCSEQFINKSVDIGENIAAIDGNRIFCIYGDLYKMSVFNVVNHKVILEQHTSAIGITNLSRNGKYAYSCSEGVCYSLNTLLTSRCEMYTSENLPLGINTLSSDRTGTLIAATCGRGNIGEYFPDVLVIDNGIIRRVNLSNRDCSYFSTCAVSPNGYCIWVSEFYKGSSLLCLNRQGDIVVEIPNAGEKISMRFTKDGKYLVALSGHGIADVDPVFDIIDMNGKIIAQFLPAGLKDIFSGMSSDCMTLTNDDRYAILKSHKDFYVVDLEEQKLLDKNEAKEIMSQNTCPPKQFSVDTKTGRITYHAGTATEQTAFVPNLLQFMELENGLITIDKSGKISLFRPH